MIRCVVPEYCRSDSIPRLGCVWRARVWFKAGAEAPPTRAVNVPPRRKSNVPRSVNTAFREEPIPQIVNTRRAAEILGRSPNTLKRWRYEGVGPDYVSHRGRIQY